MLMYSDEQNIVRVVNIIILLMLNNDRYSCSPLNNLKNRVNDIIIIFPLLKLCVHIIYSVAHTFHQPNAS